MNNPYKTKALIALWAMNQNAKSIEQVKDVKMKCRLARVNYLILTSFDQDTFRIAIENDLIENFYE